MNKDILQELINFNGEYVIGNRYTRGFNRCPDTWEAILLAPDVGRKYWVDDIGMLPFNDVVEFAEEEIKSIIHLGKEYSPFQYGIKRKSFIKITKCTCKPMDLVVRCYNEDVRDYYKVLEIMKELTPSPDNAALADERKARELEGVMKDV